MNNDIITIGSKVISILNDDIKAMVDNQIYPLVADENTKFPFIVYKRTSTIPTKVKFGTINYTVSMQFQIATDTYKKGIDVASAIKACLEGYNKEDIECEFINGYEDYNDCYIQYLEFEIKQNK